MIIGATTTWNNVDIVEACLRHYRKLGMDQLLVMDFNSSDGTPDVLGSGEWTGFVETVPFPGIAQLDSSNLLLGLAKKNYPPETLALFFDPDELLVTPGMNIKDLAHDLDPDTPGGCVIPRYNVTASRMVAQLSPARVHPFDQLMYRILRRTKRSGIDEMHHDTLDPAWIWSALPGKVLVSLQHATAIGSGDHEARLGRGKLTVSGTDTYLLHYPFRSWREFNEKTEMAKLDMKANAQHLPESYGWQLKRWIRLAGENRLREEYLAQFIPEQDLNGLIECGAIDKYSKIIEFHAEN